ncbi:retron-type reverse transcriptase domain protein (plasmid) [Acinetobacter baumannii]|nr:retron-type reverse transcriptase domain protein [Acinetobacter baumannii]
MFDEIYRMAKSRSITMTVYVDDISFTGKAVNQNFLNKIIQIIEKYQHNIKQEKIKFFLKIALNSSLGGNSKW